jgi:hypothetical protein
MLTVNYELPDASAYVRTTPYALHDGNAHTHGMRVEFLRHRFALQMAREACGLLRLAARMLSTALRIGLGR